MTDDNQDFLQFSAEVQEGIVGWMLTDYDFFLKCKLNIDHTYFKDPHVSDIVRLIYRVHSDYARHPRKGDIEAMLNPTRYSPSESQAKLTSLNRCLISKEIKALDILSREMTAWKKLILLRKSIQKGNDLYNSFKYAEATDWLRLELDKINQTSFSKEEKVLFNDGIEFYARRERDQNRNRCTLGHPMFDDAVFSGASKPLKDWKANQIKTQTNGSLVPGSTTMLIGPSNAGKTTTVVTMLFYNLMFDRKVLLVTLEEKWEDMKHYINQCVTGLSAEKFNNAANDPVVKAALEGVTALTTNNLVYIDGVRSGKMCVEDIVALVEMEQEKMKSVRMLERQVERQKLRVAGKLDSIMEAEMLLQDEEMRGFDLVIVDYPGKLKTRSLGRNTALHEEQAYIYNQFVNLALIHRFHAILPVQANREGYKAINNKKDDNDGVVLDQGHIANSFGVAMIASNVITINRGQADTKNNRIKYYIAKSRTAPATGCFVSKTDFGRRRAFGIFDLAGGFIRPGEAITEQATCQALGETLLAAAKALPVNMPPGKSPLDAATVNLPDKQEVIPEIDLASLPDNNVMRPDSEDYEDYNE
jgi:KaiC/GvpD/RAD55 family RecA-like ATPase